MPHLAQLAVNSRGAPVMGMEVERLGRDHYGEDDEHNQNECPVRAPFASEVMHQHRFMLVGGADFVNFASLSRYERPITN